MSVWCKVLSSPGPQETPSKHHRHVVLLGGPRRNFHVQRPHSGPAAAPGRTSGPMPVCAYRSITENVLVHVVFSFLAQCFEPCYTPKWLLRSEGRVVFLEKTRAQGQRAGSLPDDCSFRAKQIQVTIWP